MDIRQSIEKISTDYLRAKTEPLANHPLATFIRDQFPATVSAIVNRPSDQSILNVQGTRLPGNWATVPWIAVLDPRVSSAIQQGVYAVLLFAENMQVAYLALGMGVTKTPRNLQVRWRNDIPQKFATPNGFSTGPLPAGALAVRGLGASYEQCTIYSKRYDLSNLPATAAIEEDFREIATLLRAVGDSGDYRRSDTTEAPQTFTVGGQSFSWTVSDVEKAFSDTVDEDWNQLPGSEPRWHLVLGDATKPVKAVFRHLPDVPVNLSFTSGQARRVFEQFGLSMVETVTPTERGDLCLIGSSKSLTEDEVEKTQAFIKAKGGAASWWSFPIRETFKSELRPPFYLYLNTGGGVFPYRSRVEEYATSRGNEGIPSPWPAITEDDQAGKSRLGEGNSSICKTWFRISAVEKLNPPLVLNDFDAAPGVKQTGLLNQSSFGYAYVRQQQPVAVGASVQDPINLIVYGPPGTGKTHWLRQKFADYTDQPSAVGRDTWLQEVLSGYGWRCVIAVVLNDLGGTARVRQIHDHPWMQAKARQRGRNTVSTQMIWSFLQEHTPESSVTVKTKDRRPPFIFSKLESSEWHLLNEWRDLDDESDELGEKLKSGPSASSDVIRRYKVVTFHPSFSYEDFVRGIRPVAMDDGTTQFRTVDGVFKQICDEAFANPRARYALFIDEINRANIAKVFGELITLIETDKRAQFGESGRLTHGLTVQLPGGDANETSDPPFGVPANLDIYGTMNTADRSIALLDVALRRRFQFIEMGPDYSVIDRSIEDVNLAALLRSINLRLEFLRGRDHQIGHAYLYDIGSLTELADVFRLKIIPLLQEYFFDDWSRVRLVLSDRNGHSPFVVEEETAASSLFAPQAAGDLPRVRKSYRVTHYADWKGPDFASIAGAISQAA